MIGVVGIVGVKGRAGVAVVVFVFAIPVPGSGGEYLPYGFCLGVNGGGVTVNVPTATAMAQNATSTFLGEIVRYVFIALSLKLPAARQVFLYRV